MGARHVLAVGLVLAVLTGCTSDEPAAPPPPPPGAAGQPALPPPPPPVSRQAGEGGPAGAVALPDKATAEAYLADLRKIDPAIAGDGDLRRLVDRGRDQCGSIQESPKDQARLVDLTNRRFVTPEHPGGFGEAKAAQILKVVRKRICPEF